MKRWGLLVSIVACGLTAAACGDDDNHKGSLADAPRVDDAAAPIDGAIGELQPVTVLVTVGGLPKKDVQVYFQNVDSTLVLDAKTGDDGKAQTVMSAGGFATVIEPVVGQEGSGSDGGPTEIATFAGVKPGDVLRDDIKPLAAEQTQVSVSFSVTNEGVNHEYFAYTTCHGSGFENGIDLGVGTVVQQASKARKLGTRAVAVSPVVANDIPLTNCGATADILIVAQDSDHVITGWQYKSAVAITDGGTITFADAYQAPVDTQFNYTKLNNAVNGFDVTRALYTARGTLFTSNDNTAFINQDGTASTTFPMPAPAGVTMLTTSVGQPNSGFGRTTVVDWGAALATYDVAYGDIALSTYATQPGFDVDNHALTWSEQPGVDADFVIGRYGNSRTDANNFLAWHWRIVAPYTAGKVVYPVLPTTVYDFNLKATDEGRFLERLTTAKLPGGYDTARAYALNALYYNYRVPPPGQIGPMGQTIYQDMYSRPQLTAPKPRAAAASKRLSPASH